MIPISALSFFVNKMKLDMTLLMMLDVFSVKREPWVVMVLWFVVKVGVFISQRF